MPYVTVLLVSTSFETVKSLPNTQFAEYAFVGRSNVGKSSLINAIVGEKIARTSNTPGRTQSLNLFNMDDKSMIVDLPGYGFARVSKTEALRWLGNGGIHLKQQEGGFDDAIQTAWKNEPYGQ